jgi:formate-dependent nitrite reductase membrane component NrfD
MSEGGKKMEKEKKEKKEFWALKFFIGGIFLGFMIPFGIAINLSPKFMSFYGIVVLVILGISGIILAKKRK